MMANNQPKARGTQAQGQPPKYAQLAALLQLPEKITPQAISLAEQHIDAFIESLISHAKACAYKNPEKTIMYDHINDALNFMRKGSEKKNRWKQIGILVLGTLFGVALPEFFTELSGLTKQPPSGNYYLVIAYFVIALITLTASVYLAL